MKNIGLFVVLAVLTVVALVAWNIAGNKTSRSGQEQNVIVSITPAPTGSIGGAIRKFFAGDTTVPSITPVPSISIGPTPPGGEMTKGGLWITPTVAPLIAPESQGNSVQQLPGQTIVSLTDSGFVPATITVKAGSLVKFINASGKTMWVASDDHPNHTKLPGFDMGVTVARNGSYEYEFKTQGSWGYHNHATPETKGVVVVTN